MHQSVKNPTVYTSAEAGEFRLGSSRVVCNASKAWRGLRVIRDVKSIKQEDSDGKTPDPKFGLPCS